MMAEENTSSVDERRANLEIANMDDSIALPRANGELLFNAPWEARAFGLAVALNEAGLYPWSDFSHGLARQLATEGAAASPATYYERWLATLESLAIANGLVTPEEIEAEMVQQALLDDHDHDHAHDNHNHHHH
jgi:nitrile hydratase accessory protein